MDKNRYQEISQRNKKDGKLNKLMLCYEVFCEEKQSVPIQLFQEALPLWIASRDLQEMMFNPDIHAVAERGLDKIVKYLDEKYG